jgi:antitoxin component of MazEF toxin-antitoxin module
MRTRVQKWGNSLALRIPKPLATEIGLRRNSPVDVSLVDGRLVRERSRNADETCRGNPAILGSPESGTVCCAIRLLEVALDLENYLGAGRIFIP